MNWHETHINIHGNIYQESNHLGIDSILCGFIFFLILYPDMTYLPSSSPITSSVCWVFPLWLVLYYIKRSISKTPPFTPSPKLSYFSNHIYYQSFTYPRSKSFTLIVLLICICLMAMLNIFSCGNLAFVYLLWWNFQIFSLFFFAGFSYSWILTVFNIFWIEVIYQMYG